GVADTTYAGIDIGSVVATEADNNDLTVTVSADNMSVNEGDAASFTVTVNGGVITQDLTVNYTVSGTATAGSDYTTPSPTSLTIAANSTSGSVSIPTIADPVLDDGETLIVTLSEPLSNGVDPVTIGAQDSATATIIDGGEVTLKVYNATAAEGDPATFTVEMSGPVSSVVEVNWTTEDRTATEFDDYVANPVRLTFNPGVTALTVTVQTLRDTVAEGDETFVVKLENLTGPSGVRLAADHEGTGTIVDNVLEAAAARHDRVNQEVLPQVAQAMTASTLSAITGRFDVAVRGAPSVPTTNLLDPSDIDRFVRTNEQALKNGTLTSEQLLNRSSFLLPLSGEEDGTPGVSVWGSGDYLALSSSEEGSTDWKGNLSSFHLGADALLQPDLLAGFSVSRSIGSFEFTDRTDPVAGSGSYKSRMTTVHPYVNWSMREGLGFWATVGYGQGEVEIKEVAATRTSDTKMTAAAAGFNIDLLTKDDLFLLEGGTTKLKFKGEDAFARVEVEGRNLMDPETRINPLTSNVHRSRLSLEASHERRLESGSIVTSSLEIGLRYDGGEGTTGAGAEIGGVLSYRDPTSGLTLEGRARALVVHQDDHKEWGIGGLVRLDPDADGTGLSLTVIPAFGKVNSTIGQLYDHGIVGLAANDNAPAGNLDVEIGYGFGTFGDRGLLTPFGGWSLSGEDEQRYRIGSRFRVGPAINLSIEGERNEAANDAPPKHSIMLRGQVWF
ncbi:MAG: autotransporter domain-containing protein, partial [Rhodobacteraceae bacterium]|nr:autotransporter domain-containing protein [Paracoccaceae bacterium]